MPKNYRRLPSHYVDTCATPRRAIRRRIQCFCPSLCRLGSQTTKAHRHPRPIFRHTTSALRRSHLWHRRLLRHRRNAQRWRHRRIPNLLGSPLRAFAFGNWSLWRISRIRRRSSPIQCHRTTPTNRSRRIFNRIFARRPANRSSQLCLPQQRNLARLFFCHTRRRKTMHTRTIGFGENDSSPMHLGTLSNA